jgi:hypothetical protein
VDRHTWHPEGDMEQWLYLVVAILVLVAGWRLIRRWMEHRGGSVDVLDYERRSAADEVQKRRGPDCIDPGSVGGGFGIGGESSDHFASLSGPRCSARCDRSCRCQYGIGYGECDGSSFPQ